MIKCPLCSAQVPEGSVFCNMCGCRLEDAKLEILRRQKEGEWPMYTRQLHTENGTKTIEVWCKDVTAINEPVDLMTCSAYHGSYEPLPNTVIRALQENKRISVKKLVSDALFDFRDSLHCWVSKELQGSSVARVGCVEFSGRECTVEEVLRVLRAYSHMLLLLADMGIPIKTVVMPLVGTGRQKINHELVMIPLVSEVLNMLHTNPAIERLLFVERGYEKAKRLTETLQQSYQITENVGEESTGEGEPYVFLSFSTGKDSEAAKQMCDAIRARGIQCWFAPDSIQSGEYAIEIVRAIKRCTHFVCLISESSMKSHHVLNELDLAFQQIRTTTKVLPFRLDEAELEPAFRYYLSTIQWNYGYPPPLDQRIQDFLDRIFPQ